MKLNLGGLIFMWMKSPHIKTNEEYEMSHATIKVLLSQFKPEYVRITDTAKVAYDLDAYRQLAEFNWIQNRPYITEDFDCDKYSAVQESDAVCILRRPAFGVVDVIQAPGVLHSLNFFITSKGSLFYLEPQTGEIFPFASRSWKPYYFSI